ncbi:hypothetical protein BGZ68_009599, partial [Mortierella alpina]
MQAAPSFPDVIVCTDGEIFKAEEVTIQPLNESPTQVYISPCGSLKMFLVSVKTRPGTPSDDNRINLEIKPTAPIPAEQYLFVIHKNHPPFADTGLYGSDDIYPSGFYNTQYSILPSYETHIQVVPKETIVIEDGIMGLLGSTKPKPEYSVSITTDSYNNMNSRNISKIVLRSPTRSVREKQILRLDPFGIFTTLFLHRKTRRYLIEGRNKNNVDYGYKRGKKKREHRGYGDMASDPTLYVPQPTSIRDGFHEPINEIVQRQGQHIRQVEEDFYRLRRLLRDYYLDLDL